MRPAAHEEADEADEASNPRSTEAFLEGGSGTPSAQASPKLADHQGEGANRVHGASPDMRKTLFMALLLGTTVWAQPLPKSGQAFQTLQFDLDGNGRKETITLNAYNINPDAESYYGRLKVVDASGRQLWESPKAKESNHPFAFGSWPYGSSTIEWLGDIDGNRVIDLISPAPVSDVRPITYRRYLWQGGAFVSQPEKMLLESPLGSGNFVWSKAVDWDGVSPIAWVAKLSGSPSVVAEVVSIQAGGEIWGGQAKLVSGNKGFKATWIKPVGPPSD